MIIGDSDLSILVWIHIQAKLAAMTHDIDIKYQSDGDFEKIIFWRNITMQIILRMNQVGEITTLFIRLEASR